MSPEKMLEIATSMGDERRQPTFADMSSAQRSASMDNVVRRLAELTDANNDLNARLVSLKADYDGHIEWHVKEKASLEVNLLRAFARVDALETVTAQRWNLQLWLRLRWLLIGR
jgi:hypothetical protein